MPFQIHLLRLGRIFKPKYDIILYRDFKRIDKLGVVFPLKEAVINSKKMKVVSLNINTICFWVSRGVVLPIWLESIYKMLYNPANNYPNKIFDSKLLNTSFVNGKTIYKGNCFKKYNSNPNKPSPKFKFFRGKYIVRHWLNLKKISTK